jgi:hypothetical protein
MNAAYGSGLDVEKIMGRIMDRMPKNPVRINTRIVQDDSRFPGVCR